LYRVSRLRLSDQRQASARPRRRAPDHAREVRACHAVAICAVSAKAGACLTPSGPP